MFNFLLRVKITKMVIFTMMPFVNIKILRYLVVMVIHKTSSMNLKAFFIDFYICDYF